MFDGKVFRNDAQATWTVAILFQDREVGRVDSGTVCEATATELLNEYLDLLNTIGPDDSDDLPGWALTERSEAYKDCARLLVLHELRLCKLLDEMVKQRRMLSGHAARDPVAAGVG